MPTSLSKSEIAGIDAYWRAANYLTVGQIYLQDNPLLREPLRPEHIKPRLLGHWGTSPGLSNEEGTTTTPFDMVVKNGMSRYHLCLDALKYAPHVGGRTQALTDHCTAMLARHETYIREHLEGHARGPRLDVEGAVTAREAR
jgi:phosphoketolase